jgi:hypothetical protein
MLELLLATLDENAKTMNEKMDANTKAMKAMQEKAEAERKSDREERKAEREADREQSKADREQWKAKMDEMFAKMDRKASPEMMTATQAKTEGKLKELTEPTEEMMQSAEEHQQVPRDDAVVIPVRGRKRRHKGRKQAAERHGEPKELTRGDCGSRKKLAAACRKASRRATVAWRKRNGNYGPRKEVTAAGRKVTRCAGQKRKVQNKDDVSPKSPKGGTYEKRLWRGPECSNGIRDRGRRKIKDPSTRRKLRLKIKWTSKEIDRKTFYEISRGKVVKRAPGISIGLRQGRNWTLWRGRPPPKRKKEPHREQ